MCSKYAFIYEIKPLVEINKIEMVSNISCQMLLLKMGCFDMSFLKQTLFIYMYLITIFFCVNFDYKELLYRQI